MKKRGRILLWAAGAAAAAFGHPALPPDAPRTNVLLVTVDTLRPDRLSCYDKRFVQTPAIDALAARGGLFERAFAHTSVTLPSHANILLGLTPIAHGVSENSRARVADGFLTLAEHLKAAGYSTAAFIGAFPLDARFGLNQGFDVYDDRVPSRSAHPGAFSERTAGEVVSLARGWTGRQKGPWFCWVHVWDPHAPYLPPEPYASRFKSDPYSGEAAYVDAELGKLLSDLDRTGASAQTHVILTADHGESLGEHGELTHGYFAYNSTIHVPLLIAGPGLKARRVAADVGHVDIFPTVCDLVGLRPPAALHGRSLGPLLQGGALPPRAVYFEALDSFLNKGCAPLRGYILRDRKFMDSPIPELYDLDKDFAEKTNLAPPSDIAPFKKTYLDLEKSLQGDFPKPAERTLDRQARDRLRSLGYVVSPGGRRKAVFGPEDDLKSFLPFQQKLERAIVAADAGRFEESLALYAGLAKERPDFTPVHTYLAQTLLGLGRPDEALRALDAAYRFDPDNVAILTAYGTVLVQAGQYDPAVGVLERALAILDTDPEPWDSLGIAEWRRGEFDKAKTYFERALALDPTYALAAANLGALHMTLYGAKGRQPADLVRAIESYRRSVDIDSSLNLGHRGLGAALKTAGRLQEAAASWERAIALDPEDAFSTGSLGEASFDLGDKTKALRHLERYLALLGDRISPAEKSRIQALIEKCR
ncbi:MAG: tetratricopeptide repeat protein [Candidatus Aminicenantes bacterium]|nr:tetratricopeptide repeat protein [Candidatus Aminicenantes bacterium]